jgi:sulfite reductase alpha subunit-like flavoprotein
VDGWLQELNAARVIKLGAGDENTVASKHGSIEADFQEWNSQLWARVDKLRAACQNDVAEQDQVSPHHPTTEDCNSHGKMNETDN